MPLQNTPAYSSLASVTFRKKSLMKSALDVRENYTKEMKVYIEEQLTITMKELGYPDDVRLGSLTMPIRFYVSSKRRVSQVQYLRVM